MKNDNGLKSISLNNVDENSPALETEIIRWLDQTKLKECFIQAIALYQLDNPNDIFTYLSSGLQKNYNRLDRGEFAEYVHIVINDYYKSEKKCGRKPKDIECLPLLLFHLRIEFDFNHKEIAKIINKSEDATRRLISRSRNKLKPYFHTCYKHFFQN
jgi:hypothetical protein